MIKKFKKLTVNGLVLMALAAVTVSTQAQVPTYQAQTICSGVNITGSTATNLGALTIDVRKQKTVALQINYTNAAAGPVAGSCVLLLQRSVDGLTWDSTSPGQTVLTFTPSVAVADIITTNIQTWGCGYMRCLWWTNANVAATNFAACSLKYGVEISAP